MSDKDKKTLALPARIIIIFLICTADILVAAYFIYTWKQNGTVVVVRNASDNIFGIFRQSLVVSMVAIIVILIFFMILRKKFISEMYLKISGKKQKTTVLILTAILGAVTVFCLITKADKITILYNLLYYTVFIAMEEELLVRGICVYLLKDENNYGLSKLSDMLYNMYDEDMFELTTRELLQVMYENELNDDEGRFEF